MTLTGLADSWAYTIFSSQRYAIPVQIIWDVA